MESRKWVEERSSDGESSIKKGLGGWVWSGIIIAGSFLLMNIVIDTSAIIAVIADEPEKARLIELTKGVTLVVPPSIKWEIGNAFQPCSNAPESHWSKQLAELRFTIPLRWKRLKSI